MNDTTEVANITTTEPFGSNRESILEGVTLIADLLPILEARRAGEPRDALHGTLADWNTKRDIWGARLSAMRSTDTWSPLNDLIERFELKRSEVNILLMCLAPEVDPEFLEHLVRLRSGLTFRGLDVERVLTLLFHSREERFSGRAYLTPGAPLVSRGLIDLRPIGTELNPHDIEVRASESLANYILERPLLSGRLAEFCELIIPEARWDHVILPDEQKQLIWNLVSGTQELRTRLRDWGYDQIMPRGRGIVLMFAGPPGTGKTAFAHAITNRLRQRLLCVRTSQLVASRDSIEPILTEAFRIAAIANAVVLLDDCEALLSERDMRFLAMLEALDRNEGTLILTTNLAPKVDFAMARRVMYRLDFERPSPLLREQIWEVHLPPEAPVSSDINITSLAHTYEFSGAAIRNTVMIALAQLDPNDKEVQLTMDGLSQAAETQLGARFDDLAIKGSVDVTMDRLVLPEKEKDSLNEVLSACHNHQDVLDRWGFRKRLTTGRGICVLFDGPPGTGKTFSAEILAAELKLPLYRVHIPNIVSKWVGETERNIAEIFVRARASRALLLFDEADSLFGKRTTNAQSANDRYANMETNLILQEIERYDGITVLTTNLFGSLDEALQRRIQFRVTFPFPTDQERGHIWSVLVPPEAPIHQDVDFQALGKRFELAGGHIKNAILRAAYRAKAEGNEMRMEHFIQAGLDECKAQGKLVRDNAAAKKGSSQSKTIG
ncbi:MAG: ATP-binding protein [Myxococcota bacterium]|nr:ATP-binding protein [Myxococcota bacterium]